mgnify:FL=1
MIPFVDFLERFINPPAQPRDDIDYIIKQIKEVPRPPQREPKEGECDIRNPGAACLDMQEDLVSADDGIPNGYLDVIQADSITRESTDTENVGGMSGRATLQDHSEPAAMGLAEGVGTDSITGETIGANSVRWVNDGVNWFNMDTVENVNASCMSNEPVTANADPLTVFIGEAEFNTNPEILIPFNIDTALVTDAGQLQNDPGANNFFVSEPNQGMDPNQAREYEVMA